MFLVTTLSDIPEDTEAKVSSGGDRGVFRSHGELDSLDNFDDVINCTAADLGLESSRVSVASEDAGRAAALRSYVEDA